MECRLFLVLLGLCFSASLGCSSPAGDDEDSGSSTDDDDVVNDDDDTTDSLCEGGVLPEIDLTDPAQALDVVILPVGLLQTSQNYLQSVVGFSEPDCPDIEGDAPSGGGTSGELTLSAQGCTTALGYRYDGVLDIAWSIDGADRLIEMFGVDFTMVWQGGAPGEGPEPIFERTGLDGEFVYALDDRPLGKLISVEVEGWFLASLMDALPQADGYPAHRLFPEGWDGRWSMERLGDDVGELWTLDADVHVRCRGPLQYAWTMEARGDCEGEPESGTVMARAGGVELQVDGEADTTCDGCLDYTLDGVEQPAPLCLPADR
ncbi:MAG: hypothetical protein KDA24_11100 [Deltaproteobacteria bacterium]|nr:hypothetical protein [Deltaproteobacteria bacterium]